jgi:cobalt-zinc-cadmium efflux system protein
LAHAHATTAAHAAHAHAHGLGAHRSGATAARFRRRLAWVLCITLILMLGEFIGGLLSGSLALLADAGHMLSDAGVLGLSLLAAWVAARPAPPRQTYGAQRVEILVALLNAVILALVLFFVVRESVQRLQAPRVVETLPMFVLGGLGLLGNVAGVLLLREGAHTNLNLRSAYLEVMVDLLASIGVLVAAGLTAAFGWTRADAWISLGIAALILPRIVLLMRDVTDILMESAPRGMDLTALRGAMLARGGVAAIHDLHVWTLGAGQVYLSAHVVTRAATDRDAVLEQLNALLRDDFGIAHTTLQIEGEGSAAEPCDPCDSNAP